MHRHLTNEWLVKILGGVVAAVMGAYAVAWIGLTPSSPRTLPTADPVDGLYRFTAVTASRLGPDEIVSYALAGASPDAPNEVRVTGSGSGSIAEIGITTLADGSLRGSVRFSPSGDRLQPLFRVVARDPDSGSEARTVVAPRL